MVQGKWDDAISRETFDVRNPYSNEILYGCANCDVQDAKKVSKHPLNFNISSVQFFIYFKNSIKISYISIYNYIITVAFRYCFLFIYYKNS